MARSVVRVWLVLIAVLAAGLRTPGTRAVTPSATCGPDWTVVESPNNGTLDNDLRGAAALSGSDAWAVGTYRTASFRDVTLTQHWDGSAWTIVPSPNVSNHANYLEDVDGFGPSDVWAVGLDHATPQKPLVEHWNGTAWAITSTPSLSGDAQFRGVASLGTNDAWAVGWRASDTLIEHWDGASWSVVPSPSPTSSDQLYAISALSGTDIWAVGNKTTTSQRPFTIHWDGGEWTEVPSPDPGYQSFLYDVVVISSNDVWAVGSGGGAPYTQHWDGTSWTTVVTPPLSGGLHGVTALSGTNAWAVGSTLNGVGNVTLVLHWNGTAWSVVPSPSPSESFNILKAADSAEGQVWGVGTYIPDASIQSLIETACPSVLSIDSFSPQAGTVGSGVTITGQGFSDVLSVTFNDVPATQFIIDSPTQIRAKVPMGATTGPISIATSHDSAESAASFMVKPRINRFVPTSGPVGATVTIIGSAFEGTTSVKFNGVEAAYSVLSYSRVRATVPVGATTGPISLTTPDGQARSRTDFIVT